MCHLINAQLFKYLRLTSGEVTNFHVTMYIDMILRVLGALLSAHLLMVDKEQPFGPLLPEWYNDELLELAHELGIRLLTAFEQSAEGIPHPRVCSNDVW